MMTFRKIFPVFIGQQALEVALRIKAKVQGAFIRELGIPKIILSHRLLDPLIHFVAGCRNVNIFFLASGECQKAKDNDRIILVIHSGLY